MSVAPDAMMSGLCHLFVEILCLVIKFLGNYISKVNGLCGGDFCVPFVWLGMGYAHFVCIYAGVYIMVP